MNPPLQVNHIVKYKDSSDLAFGMSDSSIVNFTEDQWYMRFPFGYQSSADKRHIEACKAFVAVQRLRGEL